MLCRISLENKIDRKVKSMLLTISQVICVVKSQQVIFRFAHEASFIHNNFNWVMSVLWKFLLRKIFRFQSSAKKYYLTNSSDFQSYGWFPTSIYFCINFRCRPPFRVYGHKGFAKITYRSTRDVMRKFPQKRQSTRKLCWMVSIDQKARKCPALNKIIFIQDFFYTHCSVGTNQ